MKPTTMSSEQAIRCTTLGGVAAVLSVLWAAAPAWAGYAELAVPVAVPAVDMASGADGTAVISCPGAQWLSQAGEPNIPWLVQTVLLPPNASVETVAVRLEGARLDAVEGHWAVAPAPPAVMREGDRRVVAWPEDKTIANGLDTAIYGVDAAWPPADARLVGAGRLRKWQLVQVALPLLQFNPVRGSLTRLGSGTLVVGFEPAATSRSAMASAAEMADRIGEDAVRAIAVNFEAQGAEYAAAASAVRQTAFDTGSLPRYVIITTSAIQTASTKLAAFIAHKQSQGFDVSVVTEAGFGGGTGNTAAEHIRDWLKNHYVTDNIEYVLLIGNPHPDSGTVPMKWLYPRGSSGTDNSAPSDIYYADLTGNWDRDGDGYFGEYSGDMGAGGIDRFWEVTVGRIPYYGTIADLDAILQKIVAYQSQPAASAAWRRSALLPMRDPDDVTRAHWLGERIKTDTLIPGGWSYHRVYQSDTYLTPPPETVPCTKPNVTNVWKNGAFGLVLWWTHGSATSALDVMDTSYAAQLNDNNPSLTFQCSCNNAYPEVTSNLCYTLLKKGAVCAVGDTRVSWYEPGQTLFRGSSTGPGMAYEYALRIVTDNATTGNALYNLTMALSPGTAQKWMNYCVFNVYGDPAGRLLPPCGRRYVRAGTPAGGDGTSWETAYTDLQDALAEHAAEIWVAAGTYRPDRGTGNRSLSFHITRGTSLYGGFAGGEDDLSQRNPAANVTVLSGDLLGNDGLNFANNAENSYNVVTTRGCNAACVIDGFTIAGGNANNTGASYGVQDRGAGMHNYAGSSPTVRNCTFISNWAYYEGGAMCNAYSGASPIVTDCTFAGNYSNGGAGAVVSNGGSQARFTRCAFTANNGSQGGAVASSGASTVYAECLFADNIARGTGGAIRSYGEVQAINCRFLGNSADNNGGSWYAETGAPVLVNCLFSGNRTRGSGAAFFAYSNCTPRLTNCTIVANTAWSTYSNGGGIYHGSGCSATITNCILWDNGDKTGITQTAQFYGGPPVVNYSCVQGWTGSLGGTGNTGRDPLLADPDGADNIVGTDDDNPRLLPNSPCIDAGNSTAVPADAPDLDGDGDTTEPLPLDLDGRPRIADEPGAPNTGNPPGGTIVDMGAYEGMTQGFLLSATELAVPEGGTATFTVVLAKDPGQTVPVTVERVSGDADIVVQSGGSFTFDSSNYAVPRTVTLYAAPDTDNFAGVATIRVSGADIPAANLTATEADDEPVPNTLYVDADAPGINNSTDWAGAYTDIQTALWMAGLNANVNEIRVAQGTYRPAGPAVDRAATFHLKNNVALRGGYAGYGASIPNARDVELYETILSGDLAANDGPGFANNGENVLHVVTATAVGATAVLDGFTITAGNATGTSTTGGGMLIQNAGATVTHCTFRANMAGTAGGGLYAVQVGSPVVDHCRFIGNRADTGAGMGGMQATPSIVSCMFLANAAISTGGGLQLESASGMSVVNCVFNGNTADTQGGGSMLASASATFVNCTWYGNAVRNWGGGASADGMSTLNVVNGILWHNTREYWEEDDEGHVWVTRISDEEAQIGSASAVNYSCVEGWTGSYEGQGNHGNDPLLVDPDGADNVVGTADDDLRLSAGSACADAGDNDAVPAGVTTDLLDKPRFSDDPSVADTGNAGTAGPPVVDMGACEFPAGIPDFDVDGDVDLMDFIVFQRCFNGPNRLPAWENCGRTDFDSDGDVDLVDFQRLAACFNGPNNPPACE